MPDYLFPPAITPSLPVQGKASGYPLNRIFCVGRNYAEHAAEMGNEVDRETPFYFTKNPQHYLPSGAVLPYPPETAKFHYEMELALVLGDSLFRATPEAGLAAIWGYAPALDMTRRDLQIRERQKQRPWDLGKDVEGSAVVGEIVTAADFGPVADQLIHLDLNGERRQTGRLSDMVFNVGELVADLSRYYHLRPGDLIMTGTPAGVGAVQPGDRIEGGIEGLAPLTLTIGDPS